MEKVRDLILGLCLRYQQSNWEQLDEYIKENPAGTDDAHADIYKYVEINKMKRSDGMQQAKTCQCKVDEFIHLFVEPKYEYCLVQIMQRLVDEKV